MPVTVVEIPFITNTGEVIERRIACMADGVDSAWISEHPVLARRALALTARARQRAALVEAAQAGGETRAPHQPGLFDARFRVSTGDSPEPSRAPDVIVNVGQPRPLLILERRK